MNQPPATQPAPDLLMIDLLEVALDAMESEDGTVLIAQVPAGSTVERIEGHLFVTLPNPTTP